MKSLEGYKTIVAAVLSLTGALGAKYGLDFPIEEQAVVATGVMTVLMVAMRWVTKTPVGKKEE